MEDAHEREEASWKLPHRICIIMLASFTPLASYAFVPPMVAPSSSRSSVIRMQEAAVVDEPPAPPPLPKIKVRSRARPVPRP